MGDLALRTLPYRGEGRASTTCTLASRSFRSGLPAIAAALIVFGATSLASPMKAPPSGYDGYEVVRVTVGGETEVETVRRLELLERDFQVWSEVVRPGFVDVRVAPAAKPQLDASGLPYEVLIENLQRFIDEQYRGSRDGDFFDGLATYDEHVQFMADLVQAHPDLAQMAEIGTSVEGRPLWVLRISGPGAEKPGVLYHGAQHGSEPTGASLVAYLADYLLTNYDNNPEVAALVDTVEWFLLPIMNPDGYVTYDRYNAHYDLNRNWGGPGSGQDVTGGPYPFSEPETAAMRDFFLSHANVRVHVDLHGYENCILWPWGHVYDLCPDHWTYDDLGHRIRDLISIPDTQEYQIGPARSVAYFVSGGSVNYTYGELGIWAFVIELPNSQVRQTCERFLPALLFLGGWISDCNANGVADDTDLATGFSIDCNTNYVPDECEGHLDCNANDHLDLCDISDGSSVDENANSWPDECEFGCVAIESDKLLASDGDASDYFGSSVAMAGNVAVMGAPGDDDHGSESGAAYVLEFNGSYWVEVAKLVASDGSENDRFGNGVAISGETILVGAPGADGGAPDSGAVYEYRLDGMTWIEHGKLTASGANAWRDFGASLSVSGDVAVVGAPFRESTTAYVFRSDGSDWRQEGELSVSTPTDLEYFGEHVSVSGDLAVIAARIERSTDGMHSVAPYVFRFDGATWHEEGTLTIDEWLEYSVDSPVAIFGDRVLVGAYWERDARFGRVYEFGFDGRGWVPTATLRASDEPCSDFGHALAVSNDVLLIGSRLATYLFIDDGHWVETVKLAMSDRTMCGALAVHGDVALTGAGWDGDNGPAAGAVYVHSELTADLNTNGLLDICEDCNGNGVIDESDIAQQTSVDCNANGMPDECETDCNENDAPDDCDIADGVSRDADVSGVPDECEFICVGTEVEEVRPGSNADSAGPFVAALENRVLIGTPSGGSSAEGVANVVRMEGPDWVEEAELCASDGAPRDAFGAAVALGDGLAIVGAYRTNSYAGAAYGFRFQGATWSQETKFTAADSAPGDYFGASIAVAGDIAVIGAPRKAGRSGAAYVFRCDGSSWSQQAKLTAPGSPGDRYFGIAIGFAGDSLLIGAYGDNDNGYQSGSVYVWEFTGSDWLEVGKLLPSDGTMRQRFGWAVAGEVNRALVGALPDPYITESAGAAYVFEFDGATWTQTAKLVSFDGASGDWFGYSVSLLGSTALVGATGNDGNGPNAGAAYLFGHDGVRWTPATKLIATEGAPGSRMGTSVALNSDAVFVGSAFFYPPDIHAASVDIFPAPLADCNENLTLDLCDVIDAPDYDLDDDVDLADYAAFTECLSGPGAATGQLASECAYACLAAFDRNNDRHIDLADFHVFQQVIHANQ